ncbi:MAG TPA: transcriptional activator NhaR [Kofleriaceae bacterium]|nr:transcriptional activator NhaR [Kofleriaceae bacterium]
MEWLNYHHLLYFWTVAREGGLAPAGKVLRLSQSAISGQIHRLEESLGQQLFDRRGRKLEMTEMGRVVYRYAEQIFGLGRELLDVVRERPTDRPLRLVVGISDVVPKLLIRQLLAPALQHDHRVSLVCHEESFDRLLSSLAAHVLDVVISDAPVPPDSEKRLFNHVLGESTITMVAPSSLAPGLRRNFPRSLHKAPLLLPLTGSSLRRNLDSWFEAEGVQPEVVAEAEDSALLKAFAADGMGAIFIPTVIAKTVCQRYDVVEIAVVDAVRERYYAITAEKRLAHPAVLAIRNAARADLFDERPSKNR